MRALFVLAIVAGGAVTPARLPARPAGAPSEAAAPIHAGVARADITPGGPIRLGGYAARQHKSTGVAAKLWAKALALSGAGGNRGRLVIVTLDLLRAPRVLTDTVAAEAGRRYGLDRSQLLFNASHNHSGPLMWEDEPFPSVSPEEYEECRRYMQWVTGVVTNLVGAALRDLAPAALSFGEGSAAIAVNRRVAGPRGYEIGLNPWGPVDHRVPVLRVCDRDGRLRAVVFGYSCHNTAIGPASYEVSGDYAGAAQDAIERSHPSTTALFLQLAGGDQDPQPRGEPDKAALHGRDLAEGVERVLASPARPVAGPIGTAFRFITLSFAAHSRATFEARLEDRNPAQVRRARTMLKAYDEGRPVVSLEYPVQAVTIGSGLAIVAIGGEPVVDYGLRAKRELPGVVLAGYSNSVKGYVPSERVLREGGYEAGESMLYYGLPGPFAPGVEDRISEAVHVLLRLAGWPGEHQ